MKASLLSTILLLLLYMPIHAQQATRVYFTISDVKYTSITDYKYDEEGRKLEELIQVWDEETNRFFLKDKWQWSYEKGRLKSESFFSRKTETEDWRNKYSRYLEYDAAGCLQSVGISRDFPGIETEWYQESFINYENEFDCSIPWKGELERFFDDGTYSVTRKIKENNVETETLSLGSNNTLYREDRYNSKGLLIYDYDRWIFSSGRGSLREFEYDEYNNRISYKNYTERELGVFELVEKNIYEHRYENGRLMETTTSYSFENEEPYALARIEYEYYCDGLIKSNRFFYKNKETSLYIFEYDHGTKCEIEEELDLFIYPNPHTDHFIIESNGLAFENTIVNIYRLDGRLVYRQEIPERLLQLKIETPVAAGTSLAPVTEEFLIVNVISNGKSFSKKILRFK